MPVKRLKLERTCISLQQLCPSWKCLTRKKHLRIRQLLQRPNRSDRLLAVRAITVFLGVLSSKHRPMSFWLSRLATNPQLHPIRPSNEMRTKPPWSVANQFVCIKLDLILPRQKFSFSLIQLNEWNGQVWLFSPLLNQLGLVSFSRWWIDLQIQSI